ncbi:unnamed protein product (macronuclear) [Paramecium tetraurelia]|uniref:14-3-3 domain-containing protein n=1 Tax=Paramecium tetraurelia TaxID=5888 RepID=A0DD24_PARTE|nr:uncharacterized protein GSPATT00015800001 [Paramecium tetraurelia]CAK80941.1 unnamed protein product [Paramecium tetraurelia]|eukprot:XP_001448338.1 hypothetical protein (macronuclear) [Paramecium tetraurelia strain d4-2]
MILREDLVYMAKICEQAERFEDMFNFIRQVALMEQELLTEERNLLSISFKNCIGKLRTTLKILKIIDTNLLQDQLNDHLSQSKLIANYKQKIEDELILYCEDLIRVIDCNLVKKQYKSVDMMFFYKLKSDAFRYLSEFKTNDKKQFMLDEYSKTQKQVEEIFEKEISKTDPTYLGLALSQAVYTYEIFNDTVSACKIAQKAFDGALSELDQLSEDNYKDVTLIMQLLRDNLVLWESEQINELNNKEKE